MRGVWGAIITHTKHEKSNIVVELRHIAVAEAEFRGARRGAETGGKTAQQPFQYERFRRT
jgi:hypothetical protein